MQRWSVWSMVMVASLSIGCGGAGNIERAAAEGTVTVDGQPLSEGTITFLPNQSTKGTLARGTIKDGKFQLPASEGPVVGSHRVEITSMKKTGKTISVEGVNTEEVIQSIPELYNVQSSLTAEIKSGTNTLPAFELKGKIEKKGTLLPGGVVP